MIVLYVVDFNSHRVRVVTTARHPLGAGFTRTLAGDGRAGLRDHPLGSEVRFFHPTDITIDTSREALYVSDMYNQRIRRVALPPLALMGGYWEPPVALPGDFWSGLARKRLSWLQGLWFMAALAVLMMLWRRPRLWRLRRFICPLGGEAGTPTHRGAAAPLV